MLSLFCLTDLLFITLAILKFKHKQMNKKNDAFSKLRTSRHILKFISALTVDNNSCMNLTALNINWQLQGFYSCIL